MISIATKEDLAKVKVLGRGKAYLDDADVVYYCLFREDDLVAYVASRPLVIKLGKHLLRASDIIDIVAMDDEDREDLVRAVSDYREHTELLSFSKVEDDTLKELGYKKVYPKVSYTFDRYKFKSVLTDGVRVLSDPEEALDAYAKMMANFDAYVFRDLAWFRAHIKKDSAFFRIAKDAYFTLRLTGDTAYIDELVYSYLEEVDVAIAYALKYAAKAIVTVSAYERLERYYDEVHIGPKTYSLGRINDASFLSKLYGSDFRDIKKALTMSARAIRLDD